MAKRKSKKFKQQQGLFSASLRTWTTILQERIRLYNAAYGIWVTQLRQESTRRKKLALHKRERDCSYLRWPTPTSMIQEDSQETYIIRAARLKEKNGNGNGAGMNLGTAVRNWATATASDYRVTGLSPSRIKRLSGGQKYGQALPEQVQKYSQWDKEQNNTTGKNREQLNPAWVAQLQGTTLEKTFFVPRATAWLNKPQN